MSELLYLHVIADPCETVAVREVFVTPFEILKLSASWASVWTVQLDPPFVEYSTVT